MPAIFCAENLLLRLYLIAHVEFKSDQASHSKGQPSGWWKTVEGIECKIANPDEKGGTVGFN
jgi:hypothetical protein